MSIIDTIRDKEQANKTFEGLVQLKNDIIEKGTFTINTQLYDVLQGTNVIQLSGTEKKDTFLAAINQDIRSISMKIQSYSQDIGVMKGKVTPVPHIDTTLRKRRMKNQISYPARLVLVFSPEEEYGMINRTFLESELADYKNKGAVYNNRMADFIEDHMVIDPDKLNNEGFIKYILKGKSPDELIQTDPRLLKVKQKLTHPKHLQYVMPAEEERKYTNKHTTSRITFLDDAILVFRSDKSHPIVQDPTKHEQKKINFDVKMQITNSSYDVITEQYQAVQSIINRKVETMDVVMQLKNILSTMLIDNTVLDNEQKETINQTIEVLVPEVNPQILMTRLYNLAKIPLFKNKTVQSNLLEAAMRKIDKRIQELGYYLYYMIPQLQAFEKLHEENIKNVKILNQRMILYGTGNQESKFVKDQIDYMEPYDSNDVSDRIKRKLRGHGDWNKLMGFFHNMRNNAKHLIENYAEHPQKRKTTLIMAYTNKLVLLACQLKQDVELGTKVDNVRGYFSTTVDDIMKAGFDKVTMETNFNPIFDKIEKMDQLSEGTNSEIFIKKICDSIKEEIEIDR